ncbi:proline-rich protein 15 [Lampris incognitus]|uniref:proline-rich protein 15 n=1 Tax=Lampris incognitus TaxID=2546036 RepID=UPI0024B53E52|nr:proline-rich protein 15 [Lampris incognitus]
MAERAPWWRAFLVKRKSVGGKDAGLASDFDPFASQPEKPKDPIVASKTANDQPALQAQQGKPQQPEQGTSLLSDETYDDSQLDSVFNEQTCRRNMRVSRSGRFKEKRRVRSSLPIEEERDKTTSAKEDQR